MQQQATRDLYQEITDHIIAAIERGIGNFEMPWHRDADHAIPSNALTGSEYNGVNVIALWVAAIRAGFRSSHWATYKQWLLLGGQVRRGEKASTIVFFKQTRRVLIDEESGEHDARTFRVARASRVFNADQVDGNVRYWKRPEPIVRDPARAIDAAERFVAATGADIQHGGDRAFYKSSTDHIQMPERERFTGTTTSTATEAYYATLLHELTHWSGHEKRLNRNFSERFKEKAYAMEELVAELGAAFLCCDLSITNTPRDDHAAYVAHWLSVLRNDKRAIFTAARRANEARAFLNRLQGSCDAHGDDTQPAPARGGRDDAA